MDEQVLEKCYKDKIESKIKELINYEDIEHIYNINDMIRNEEFNFQFIGEKNYLEKTKDFLGNLINDLKSKKLDNNITQLKMHFEIETPSDGWGDKFTDFYNSESINIYEFFRLTNTDFFDHVNLDKYIKILENSKNIDTVSCMRCVNTMLEESLNITKKKTLENIKNIV
ncbi:MAG: hypothetical protein FWF50_04865, partial [Defluviitaleaceae bacterium]|nr:hypothetical protein [Defluviitaleaceae bacterium]